MNTENVVSDNSNTDEVVVPETTTEETVEETTEQTEQTETVDWESEAKKAKELANNYKIRAEKAEGKNKGIKPTSNDKQANTSMSLKDSVALVRANIDDESIETVERYAKFAGKSIADALKDEDLKAILDRRANVKKTASVTNTSSARRTVSKPDPAVLISKLSKGEVPEKGSADAEEIFWARRGGKR